MCTRAVFTARVSRGMMAVPRPVCVTTQQPGTTPVNKGEWSQRPNDKPVNRCQLKQVVNRLRVLVHM